MKNNMTKQLLTFLLILQGTFLLAHGINPELSFSKSATTKYEVNFIQTKDTLTSINQKAWDIYEKYIEGWKPISKETRKKIASEIMTENVEYTTPRHETGDRNTVIKDMEAFQARVPGGHFEIRDVSAHHDVALVTWDLIQANGKSFAKGHDQIRISTEGKIIGLITFAPSVSKK